MATTATQLRRLADLIARAGLDQAPAVDLLAATEARERDVIAAHNAALAGARDIVNTAADEVAATPTSFADAARAVVIAEGIAEPARKLRGKAIARIAAEAHDTFAAMWPDLDTDIIAAHDQALTDLAKLAPTIAGIADDQAAVKAGHPVATAWAKADTIAARRAALIALRAHAAEMLALPDYHPTDDLRQYRRPENLRAWPARATDAPRHRVTRLIDDIDAGAEPALCTDDEVAATAARLGTTRPARVHPFGRNDMALASLGRYPQD